MSERERVAHVLRRLSMGVQPDMASALATADDAIHRALDLSAPPRVPPALPSRAGVDRPTVRSELVRMAGAFRWWFARMASPERMISERLTWFWTDHFAISMAKVRSADLVWQYHALIREHATGSFADLLHAISKSGAMLVYLDGIKNGAKQHNENFAREVMELHTLGRDQYTQDDVVAGTRACTGWIVRLPFIAATERYAPARTPEFGSYFVPPRHDAGTKTFLGATGAFDLDGALDVILSKPETARFVGAKLYRAIVGLEPDRATVDAIAAAFRRDWSIMDLVHAIVEQPGFRSDAAVRTVVRTPVEKLTGLAQAVGTTNINVRPALTALRDMGFVPFFAPNPAGYPDGIALLGPQQLLHSFDLAFAVDGPVRAPARDVLARFGVFDATTQTRTAIANAPDARRRTLLALGAPEFCLR